MERTTLKELTQGFDDHRRRADGLFAAFYASMRGASAHHRLAAELGGPLTALYPEKYVYDVGSSRGSRPGLATSLIERGLQFGRCASVAVQDLTRGRTATSS